MALQNSGAISLDDIHVEAGGTSGTSASINDSDIRGLIDKSSEATMAFNEWYGAQNIGYVEGTGGTTSESGNFRFHTFNSSGTFDITATAFNGPSNTIDYVVIAGGGAGGTGRGDRSRDHSQYAETMAGGGGAGGYISGTFTATTGAKSVTIGAGGASTGGSTYTGVGAQTNGSQSSLAGVTTSTGGGSGAYYAGNPGGPGIRATSGGSGGGGSGRGRYLIPGVTSEGTPDKNDGISGQGNDGAVGNPSGPDGQNSYYTSGGGGGGAGADAPSSGTQYNSRNVVMQGGTGSSSGDAAGSTVRAGGGGAGGAIFQLNHVAYGNRYPWGGQGGDATATSNAGGAGRGAQSYHYTQGYSGNVGNYDTAATSGDANTGGGGGGGGGKQASGAGGSGVVIVRYQYQGA